MKRIILFIPLLLAVFTGFSQEEKKQENDTTKIRIGNSTVVIHNHASDDEDYDIDFSELDSLDKKDKDDDWVFFSVDLGMNGYMTPDYKTALPQSQQLMELNYAKSRTVGLNLTFRGAEIVKDRLYVTSGIGVAWNRYAFKNNVNVSVANDSTAFTLDTLVKYDKYRLRATYLQVPLIIGTRIGNLDRPLSVQVGVIASYKIGSSVKRKYTLNNTNYRSKVKDDFNINPFKFDAVAKLAIGDVGLYARYALTPLFEDNKAPELYPFSVGLTIGGFTGKS